MPYDGLFNTARFLILKKIMKRSINNKLSIKPDLSGDNKRLLLARLKQTKLEKALAQKAFWPTYSKQPLCEQYPLLERSSSSKQKVYPSVRTNLLTIKTFSNLGIGFSLTLVGV